MNTELKGLGAMYQEKYQLDEYCGWYALFTLTGEEENVRKWLMLRFENSLQVLVPKRLLRERKAGVWHETVRTIFPGYVLVEGHIGSDDYYRLKGIPGLIKLLRTGTEPTPVNASEMKTIARLCGENETIGFSDALMENGCVTITSGPLLSMEGIVLSIDKRKGRAKVALQFLGEERTIELGVQILQPAK